MTATALLVWGALIHGIVDWIFQNDWMASNKGIKWAPGQVDTDWSAAFKHPAGYVHGALHGLALWLIFPWWAALLMGIIHWLVDLRVGLVAWRHYFGQDQGPVVVHVAIWQDQVVHFATIGLFALLVGQG